METSMDRRHFLLGAALSGMAVAGAGALAGCAPQTTAASGDAGSTELSETDEGANPTTAPIDPVEPPASWDDEADIVIVGSGGGGLNAAARATQLGLTAIVLEKSSQVGGNSRSATMFTIGGGTDQQNEAQKATPSYPYDVDKWVEYMMMGMSQGANPDMLRLIGENLAPCFKWMTETYDLKWSMGPNGDFFAVQPVGMDLIIDSAHAYGEANGAKYLLDTEVTALVRDGDRVVGVKAKGKNGEIFLKGAKAVLLTGGGFIANRDLLAEYCPSVLDRAASCYLAPSDSGECFRMGLGVGAAVTNRNSYCMFDGGMDWYATGAGDWTHYLYDGATQVVRQPWLNIRNDGTRNRYIATSVVGALTDQGSIECGAPGNRSYVIFDGNWDTYMQGFGQKACREPIQDGVTRQPFVPEYYQDYHAGFQDAIDAGLIRECQTIEELAEALELDADMLKSTVDKWNATVASGVDDAVFPYNEAWLTPIDTPPYYGAKIGGNAFMTQTGLLINTKMQVVDTAGKVIPGLYAGWHTAGGAAAPDVVTSMAFDTGGVSKSYMGGYLAAASIAENE